MISSNRACMRSTKPAKAQAPRPKRGTLAWYAERYCQKRGFRPQKIVDFRRSVRLLDSWRGRPVRVDELSDDLLDRFITHVLSRCNPSVSFNHWLRLSAMWRDAYENGLTSNARPGCRWRRRRIGGAT